MKASVGDRLIVDGEGERVGLVIGVRNEDGTPPYVIRWLSDGHVTLVFPGPYARIVPASHPAGMGRVKAHIPIHVAKNSANHLARNSAKRSKDTP